MTFDEQMQLIVKELIAQHGLHYKISLAELQELLSVRFQANSTSVIPSDYCYNRVNKGIYFDKKPRLFSFLGDGIYECLGENYPYSGTVYTRPKGSKKDISVGVWQNGIFKKGSDWDLYDLK